MATIRENTIFTNCALTDDGDVWWEGMTHDAARARDRLAGQRLDARSPRRPAAHPERALHHARPRRPRRSRRSGRTPAGVPIDAFLFGGRRATVVPLVREAFDWEHGVFLGATMSSETTAAAAGGVGQLRFDPLAMLPFCGYNMADYFAHWLEIGAQRRRRQAAEDLLRQLVPQGRRRQLPVARLRREQPRAGVGLPPLRRRGRGASRRRSASCPPPGDLNVDGLDLDADGARGAADRRRGRGARRAAAGRASTWRSSATTCPATLRDELQKLEARLG